MEYVFLHGLGQGSASWQNVVSHMENPKEPREILCPELNLLLQGQEVVYANLYHEFEVYCSKLSSPFHLCGLSLGGVLALNYAIEHPEKVSSLVLIGTPYTMPKLLLKIQNIIFQCMPQSVFEKMGFKKKDFISLTNSMADLDFSKNLKDVTCACLVVCGEKDSANKKAAKGLAANLENAKLWLVENAGHEVNLDAPDTLAAVLDEFYKEQ